ncbi:MAG: aliphatic sulfonates family transporter, periplasmic ligand-binding protein [Massilia sp.]|jgi:hypothetical protein|nr:aliphatic sulfonates family transporter, periplasmic ligand-binding protein [Massilia sp.]MDB5950387.1 aliphatic sulfonates family transporter, periplasmic ligand-binding protein [Massilia sp.]
MQYRPHSSTSRPVPCPSLRNGSSAGLAALLSKANGDPIRAPYIFSRPEWAALVVPKTSNIRTLADLRGKKIAATKGTDPCPVYMGVASGIRGVDRKLVEVARLYRLGSVELARRVLLPAALPAILTGLRNRLSLGGCSWPPPS